MKISVAIATHNREKELQKIIKYLRKFDFFDEFIIWNDGDPIKPIYGTKIIESKEKEYCWSRFLAAYETKNLAIYTQDDDCILRNLEELYGVFVKNQDKVVRALKKNAGDNYKDKFKMTYAPMIGWGTFFMRGHLSVFDRYKGEYDFLFKREVDRIFSYLTGEPISIEADVYDFESASAEESLGRHPKHLEYGRLALERVQNEDSITN